MDLSKFRRAAARNKAPLRAFLKKLDDIVPEDMPVLVAEEDQKVWAETDCLACANCCKTMTPTFSKADIQRISKFIRMSPKDFVAKWLYKEEETGEWMNRSLPCQFLGSDNKCTVYEVRPKDCAEFPHHNKQPFDLYNETFHNNIMYCPATYKLISRLKQRVEREYEW